MNRKDLLKAAVIKPFLPSVAPRTCTKIWAQEATVFACMAAPSLSPVSARTIAASIDKAMGAMLPVARRAGSCVADCNYLDPDRQKIFWSANYPGLLFLHRSVDSESSSADGFTRVCMRR